SSLAIFVPAPGLLSTTNCWPRSSYSLGASSLAVVPPPPPVVNPPPSRTGRVGYCCAAASWNANAKRRKSAERKRMAYFSIAGVDADVAAGLGLRLGDFAASPLKTPSKRPRPAPQPARAAGWRNVMDDLKMNFDSDRGAAPPRGWISG